MFVAHHRQQSLSELQRRTIRTQRDI